MYSLSFAFSFFSFLIFSFFFFFFFFFIFPFVFFFSFLFLSFPLFFCVTQPPFFSFLRWRLKYLSVLAWMGRSTLETYLLQFHLFLSSSSKTQVVYVPGYPYVNFLVGTTIFLYLSHKTLHLTNTLSDALISYSVHNPPSLIL